MKNIFVALPLVALLSLSACTSVPNFLTQPPPPPPVNPVGPDDVTNKICRIIDTISWAVPVVQGIVERGVDLGDAGRIALNDAIQIIGAGCEADNASWQQRAVDAAKKLLDIVGTFQPLKLRNAHLYIPRT